MKYEDHCTEAFLVLENRYEEINKWLDEFANKPGIGLKHRRYRHHLAGISEIKKLYGKDASKAAMLHIISDLKEEGWKPTDHFPVDEKDYVSMGFY